MNQRIALVTGAAAGIGASCAERLARDGHHVVVSDVDGDGAAAVAKELENLGFSASYSWLDVSDPESVTECFDGIKREFGGLHILVNNAGIAGAAGEVVAYDYNEWRRVLAVDLDGVFLCCRAALPLMLEQGWGRIINIASISGKEGNPRMSAYSAAKAGVIGFTKALAKEVARSGVIANVITPAVIHTDILDQLDPAAVNYMLERVPMGRPGEVAEVAGLVAWLAGDECSFSTGAVFDISGGRATY